jgi:predicted ABC-type transport system involved in lysophospholipase L1 biosynthesis ATPase subunit
MMSLLTLEHVSKGYPDGRGKISVLTDVSWEIEDGDMIGVWGMRRSGKSTLLRVASGQEQPDEGVVCFDGQNMAGLSPDDYAKLLRHRGIGLLGSDWRPLRSKAVIEHVALPLLSDGMSLRDARGPAWRALERVGATGCAHLPATRLSHGERVRVHLAQLLVHEPQLLLVDEPAALLRPGEGLEFCDLLRSLNRDLSIAVVIASEDVAPMRKMRRVMSIGSGKLRSMEERGTLVRFPERTAG